MDFDLTAAQRSWQDRGRAVGQQLTGAATAASSVSAAAGSGLLDPAADLLSVAVAVEAMAIEHASAAIAFALHSAVLRTVDAAGLKDAGTLASGGTLGAIALSSDELPGESNGVLSGRATWVAPLGPRGFAIIGAQGNGLGDPRRPGVPPASGSPERQAYLVSLADAASRVEPVETAGLGGLVCGHVSFDNARCVAVGPTGPVMAAVRVLLASAGLGMGRRALRESMSAARASGRTGAGGEQTVQGLLADAATELDAAMLLVWKAVSAGTVSLASASMAKLAATEATQRAVARATQMIGGESFRHGHVIGRLSQDVRALELFAGRTEALREAVALEVLP